MLSRRIQTAKTLLLLVLIGFSFTFNLTRTEAAEYVIQPEDVVSVRVDGHSDLSKNYTVDENGNIVMDRLGNVRISGLTAKQTEEKLTKELGQYFKLFEVHVVVISEAGSRVLVYGEVSKQGAVKLRSGTKLLDALAQAGGTTDDADTKRISIARAAGGKTELVDLETVMENPSLDIQLQSGDTVIVPSKTAHAVRVDGEVRSAGMKSLEEVRTAYAAVQAAEPTERADWSRIILRRKDSSIPLPLDLSKVRTGQLKDDFQLQAGDRLTVMSKFSGTVTLRGEVKSPGEKDLNGPTQLWDLITSAGGGFTEYADRMQVQVLREGEGTKTIDLLAVAEGLRRSDDPALEVKPGDVIFIPRGTARLRGEVNKPAEHPLGSTRNLWDFIMGTGEGFTERADRTRITVIRNDQPLRTVDLTKFAAGEKSYDDPELEIMPGDVIIVPNDERNRFVIVGGVIKPGAYPVKPGMTLFDALAVAGGLSERAKVREIVIAPADRFNADGTLRGTEVPGERKSRQKKKDALAELGLKVIDLKKLSEGDATQMAVIQPGDRIFIPVLPPPDTRIGRRSLFESVLRMVPLIGLFTGGNGGYYPSIGF